MGIVMNPTFQKRKVEAHKSKITSPDLLSLSPLLLLTLRYSSFSGGSRSLLSCREPFSSVRG